jgi:hypothetical protein
VESSSCVGGGPNDGDLIWIQENALELLDAKFEGLNQVTWGADNRGWESNGPNAPILDQIPPP